LANEGPDRERKKGLSLSTGSPNKTPHEVELTLILDAKVRLENTDSSGSVPPGIEELFIADIDSKNIYQSGQIIADASIPDLAPGEETSVHIRSTVEKGHPSYNILRSGRFRTGIRIRIQPTGIEDVDLRYEIKRLNLSVRGYPFGFLP
jgi:hypothetical protein